MNDLTPEQVLLIHSRLVGETGRMDGVVVLGVVRRQAR